MRAEYSKARLAADKGRRIHAFAGQLLVLFATLLMLVMPWTEQHWTFDGFLQGRPDFELSLLSLIVMFCLVLLVGALAKRGVALMAVLRASLSSVDAPGPKHRSARRQSRYDTDLKRGWSCGPYNLPLQI